MPGTGRAMVAPVASPPESQGQHHSCRGIRVLAGKPPTLFLPLLVPNQRVLACPGVYGGRQAPACCPAGRGRAEGGAARNNVFPPTPRLFDVCGEAVGGKCRGEGEGEATSQPCVGQHPWPPPLRPFLHLSSFCPPVPLSGLAGLGWRSLSRAFCVSRCRTSGCGAGEGNAVSTGPGTPPDVGAREVR